MMPHASCLFVSATVDLVQQLIGRVQTLNREQGCKRLNLNRYERAARVNENRSARKSGPFTKGSI